MQIYKVCNSRVTRSWKYIFLYLPVFTDFFEIEMLTSLFSFFLRNAFHPLFYLKRALIRLEKYPEFSRFFSLYSTVLVRKH